MTPKARISAAGVAGGTVAIAAVSILVSDAPTRDAITGAVVGVGGAIAAIVMYLLNRRR